MRALDKNLGAGSVEEEVIDDEGGEEYHDFVLVKFEV
jgi:hypothetical protein